jgi:hypothetical protein
MPFQVFKKVIDEFREIGGDWVDLTGIVGEPLTDTNLFDKLSYAKQIGIRRVQISTNAILLTRQDNYKRLLETGIDLVDISTPGLSADAYRRIFRVDKYEQAMEGIIRLADYKKVRSINTRIALKMRIDRPVHEAMQETGVLRIRHFIETGIIDVDPQNCFDEMHNWGGLIQPNSLPGTMHLRPVPEKKGNIPCGIIFINPAVLPDGQFRMCSCRCYKTEFDDLVVGDTQKDSLLSIVRGRRTARLIKRMSAGDWPKACRACSYYSPFGPFKGPMRYFFDQ